MTSPLPPVPDAQSTDRSGRLVPPWQSWFYQLYTYLTATSSGGGGLVPLNRQVNTTAPIAGGGTLANDLTISLTANGVTNTYLAQMPAGTLKGNNTGGAANATDLTVAQVNAMLPVLTSTLNGLAPLSGGGTTNYLRADGTWASPPGSGITTNAATFNNGGAGGASGSTFNGSAPLTVSYNTIGAPSTTGTGASGTWSISISGVAATATALATARAINGVNFDGTAAITVTAAAGTLTGTTLNSTVVTSSLTTIGTLVAGSIPGSLVTGTVPASTTAGSVTNSLTVNNSNSGAASGATFNGGSAVTISANTVGALPLTGGTLTGALTITGVAATPIRSMEFNGTTTGFNYLEVSNTSGSLWWGIEGSAGGGAISGTTAYSSFIGSSGAQDTAIVSNATVRMVFNSSGNATLKAPSSGQTLTLAPSPSAGELIATSSALTSGAGASVGTLTNAPSAGNPTKWIKINDNGTIRSIPAW